MSVAIISDTWRKDHHKICHNMLNYILMTVPVIVFVTLIAGSAHAFVDDFSTDKGWISDPSSGQYYIKYNAQNQNVDFHTYRGSVQKMYYAIDHKTDPLDGDFELTIDANLEDTNANGYINIGLTDDITDVNWYWKGVWIVIGQYAGYHYAQVAARYSDGSMYFSLVDDPAKDKHIDISTNKWYTYKLTITNDRQNWKLDAYDQNGNLAGSISGEFTGSFSLPFNYVLFGNGDTHQWETADGRLDNIKLESSLEHQIGCLPGLPGLPGLHEELPVLPGLPGLPGLHEELPVLPGLPGLPGLSRSESGQASIA